MPGMTLRLDDTGHRMLRALTLTRHASANQILTGLIAEAFDREFPGQRARIETITPEQRQAAMLAALGLDALPTSTPEEEADLCARQRHAEAEAQRIYGEPVEQSAA